MVDTPTVVRETNTKAKRLSTGQIVMYGVPRFANNMMSMTIGVFLAKFYTDTLYLPAGIFFPPTMRSVPVSRVVTWFMPARQIRSSGSFEVSSSRLRPLSSGRP